MTNDNWKTLRVPKEAYEQAKEQKEEHNRTWGQQLVCNNTSTSEGINRDALAEDRQEQLEKVVHGATNDVATVGEIEDVVEELRQLEQSVNEVVENMQQPSADVSPDTQVITDEIVGRINDLEAELPRKVTEELQR